jgi:hypothetical protein
VPSVTAAGSSQTLALRAQFPARTFRRAGNADSHHVSLRYRWELVVSDGTVTLAGLDIGGVAPDGRFPRISGFFGEFSAP